MPDLSRYGLFIHLGSVQAPGRLELALQALVKILRCQGGNARLLVAADASQAWPRGPVPAHCDFHSPIDLMHSLRRTGATVLAPAFSDPQGDITLHAIASGVPLGALNLAPMCGETGMPSLDGHAFLAVARAAERPH